MDWNDFVFWTDTTAKYPEAGTGGVQELAYIALGLAGEAGECLEMQQAMDYQPGNKAFTMELGDCFWYVARAYRALHLAGVPPLQHVAPIDPTVFLPALLIGNETKKLMRDGITEEQLLKLRGLYDRCFSSLSIMLNDPYAPEDDLELPGLLDMVVDKLESRKARDKLGGSGDNR